MRRVIGSVVGLIVAMAVAGPALAVTVETSHHVDTLVFPRERCGSSWIGDIRLERLVQIRTADALTPPTITENYELTARWTDVADPDRQWVVVTQGQTRDVPVRLVEGTTWEFRWSDIGHPAQWRTSQGRIIEHDRGRLDIWSLRDTLGDADPSNDVHLGDTDLSFRGKFPSLVFDEADFCEVILEAVDG